MKCYCTSGIDKNGKPFWSTACVPDWDAKGKVNVWFKRKPSEVQEIIRRVNRLPQPIAILGDK